MKNWPRIATLILPLVALAASWAFTHYKVQQGTNWIVPIRGYDPRDLLRGHYIVYRYTWPGLPESDNQSYISALCIKGKAPTITAATIIDMPSLSEQGPPSKCAITARVTPGGESYNGLATGKIYIAQTKAADFQKKLNDPKLAPFVYIRIRDDGIITPIKLDFKPRATLLPK